MKNLRILREKQDNNENHRISLDYNENHFSKKLSFAYSEDLDLITDADLLAIYWAELMLSII